MFSHSEFVVESQLSREKVEKKQAREKESNFFIAAKARSVQGKSEKNNLLHVLMRQIGQGVLFGHLDPIWICPI